MELHKPSGERVWIDKLRIVWFEEMTNAPFDRPKTYVTLDNGTTIGVRETYTEVCAELSK